ncbi:MAG: hypothetical protein AAF224_05800 [Pseudomonadota bacterium]
MQIDLDPYAMPTFGAPYVFEGAVVAFIMSVFTLYAAATLRARHRDVGFFSVLGGAAVYGVLIGLVIAFIILPMRAVLMSAETPPEFAALGGILVFLTMFSLRRGVAGRLPFLGRSIKAFRRAQLRKTIETAEKQLLALGGAVATGDGVNDETAAMPD